MTRKTTLTITQRVSWEDNPFSELLFVVVDKGVTRHYLSRVPYVVSDTQMQHEHELQEFQRRQARR